MNIPSISASRLDMALLAAEPRLEKYRAHAEREINGTYWRQETALMEAAARTRVRRVMAALNGHDIELHTSPWTDPPAILERSFADRLKMALLNENVALALGKEIGKDAAAIILGEISLL